MTAISPAQAARPSRLGMSPHHRDQRWSIIERQRQIFSSPVQLREQFEIGNLISRPEEFAGGFVDFLLGRGARHSR
jgi:hypothetical protein